MLLDISVWREQSTRLANSGEKESRQVTAGEPSQNKYFCCWLQNGQKVAVEYVSLCGVEWLDC